MEFKQPDNQTNLHSINGGDQYKTNPAGLASNVMPAPVKQLMGAIAKKHGLQLDVTDINLKTLTPAQANAYGKVSELVFKNSKALPILYKHTVKLLKSEVAEAQFYAAVTKECLDAKAQIDEATAAAFLAMHGYKTRTQKLEARIAGAVKIMDKRAEAYATQYESKVGDSLQIVDAWLLEGKALSAHRTGLKKEQIKSVGASKQSEAEYLQKMKYGHLNKTKSDS